MELTNEKVINAPRSRVYDALHDAQILRQAVPGCQALSKVAPDQYEMTVALKVGPIKTTFSGTITLYNEDAPAGFSMRGQGHGSAGAAEGHAHVALAAIDPTTTNLAYHVSAELDGQVGTLEEAVVETAARTMAAEFFSRLTLLLEGEMPALSRATPINQPATPALPHQDFLREASDRDDGDTATLDRPSTPLGGRVSVRGAPEAEPTASDVITVGGSRTDDLGVYRDTVPGAHGGFDADPHYTGDRPDGGRPAGERRDEPDAGEESPAATEDGASQTMRPLGKDHPFSSPRRRARGTDEEVVGGPLRFVWRLFLISLGLILIYLLLTDGI